MMADRISPKDFELLSAYLDGQVSAGERQRLDSRLAREADLRRALAQLRQTRELLRTAPHLQRPRSFALTPEMVKSRARLIRAFSAVRMVSIVAGILFAFLFAGDLFFNSFRVGNIAFAPQAGEMAAEADMAEESIPAGDDQELDLEMQGDETPEVGGDEDTAAGAAEAGEAGDAVEDAAQPPTGGAESEMTPTGMFLLVPEPTSLATASPALTPTPLVQAYKLTDTGTASTRAQATGTQPSPPPQPYLDNDDKGLVESGAGAERESGLAVLLLKIAEIALAFVAVAGGLAAWLMRRGSR